MKVYPGINLGLDAIKKWVLSHPDIEQCIVYVDETGHIYVTDMHETPEFPIRVLECGRYNGEVFIPSVVRQDIMDAVSRLNKEQ